MTMPTSPTSPTPWKAEQDLLLLHQFSIVDAAGRLIADCLSGADAEHIVRVVNAAANAQRDVYVYDGDLAETRVRIADED